MKLLANYHINVMNQFLNATIKTDLNTYEKGDINIDNKRRIKLMLSILLLILSVM